jgi:putative DNA-binding protein
MHDIVPPPERNPMPSLAEIQDAYAAALLDRASPVPAFIDGSARRRSERRFAVYRNNVAAGLITALATRFPVVKRLVGDEFFRAMAHAYATTELPRSPLMLYYGETFPAFIEGFAPAAPIPYLADIARIEMARGLAYHAADASTLEAEEFAAIPEDHIGELRVQLHPSVSIIVSDYPIYSIWHVNQDPERFAPVSFFKRESVLIARPYLRVKTLCISREIAEFVRALAAGKPLAEAIDITSAAEALTFLIKARIVTALDNAYALHH